MFAVVGLGNPGPRYAGTRHNVGFWAAEELLRRLSKGSSGFSSSKFGCVFSKVQFANADCLIVQPQKYMNLSGEAVAPLLRYFRVEPQQLVVIHDELDLPPGVLRLKAGGGAAGHNGLRDLIQHLGTADFFRVRVGIGRPGSEVFSEKEGDSGKKNNFDFVPESCSLPVDVVSWVLSEPGPKGKELLQNAVIEAASAVEVLLSEGLSAAQRKFHKREVAE